MNKNYEWNPIYVWLISLKSRMLEYYEKNNISPKKLFEIDERDKNFIEKWVKIVGNDKDKEKFNLVNFTIKKSNDNKEVLVLVKYKQLYYLLSNFKSIANAFEIHKDFLPETRTVVIDIINEELVICNFKKFFNMGEIDDLSIKNISKKIKTAKKVEIAEKLDGSMQGATWSNTLNKFIMCGSSSLDASIPEAYRLKIGYDFLESHINYQKMLFKYNNYSFTFENVSLRDKHIVIYNKEDEGLYLVGIRDKNSGRQLSYEEVKSIGDEFGILMPKILNISFDDVLLKLKSLKVGEMEGFVINIDGYFVKMKSDEHVGKRKQVYAYRNPKFWVEPFAKDNFDDVFSKIPENFKDDMEIKASIKNISKKIEVIENKIDDIIKKFNSIKKENENIFTWLTNNTKTPKISHKYITNKYLTGKSNILLNKKKIISLKELDNIYNCCI